MTTPEQKKIDRTGWPAGPWDGEPDRVDFTTAAGLPAIVLRQETGHLCGYVAVPPGHVLHSVGYNEESEALGDALKARLEQPVGENPSLGVLIQCAFGGDLKPTPDHVLRVHGGITFADGCRGHVCHAPAPGEPDNVWWFGFDCAHCDDLQPGSVARREEWGIRDYGAVYRTVAYVRAECESLAAQLAAVGQ